MNSIEIYLLLGNFTDYVAYVIRYFLQFYRDLFDHLFEMGNNQDIISMQRFLLPKDQLFHRIDFLVEFMARDRGEYHRKYYEDHQDASY